MKFKNTYFLLITIIGLFSLILYSTYAMFTATVEVGEFVNLTASTLPTDTSLLEYERITLNTGDSKTIDLNITNNTDDSLYYGVWYEMVEPSTINDGIIVAKLDTSTSETFGNLSIHTTLTVTLLLENNTSDSIIINIGVGYSSTNSLNLPDDRSLVTDVASEKIKPNKPDLIDGLIPITYSNDKWVKADSSNTDNSWYNYDNKKWANAVLVTDTNRSSYQNASVGTEVLEADILAYYVWIPRYKYKVWNITKTIGVDSYDAYNTGIDIVFESDTNSTGTINCNNYSFAYPTSSTTNETCTGSNLEYYTHPAFTFGDAEVAGIWVGKFEVSKTTYQIQIKPNKTSLVNVDVSTFWQSIYNMQKSGNVYGLTIDKTKVDSHMLKNMEWGAVAYLTNSNYGRCSDGTCTEVGINNYQSSDGSYFLYTTGCGNNSTTCNEYDTTAGMLASTTGNIYGIYDMNGGTYEYVMGNMSSNNGTGSYTYYEYGAGSNFSYSGSTAKYIDTYAYGDNYSTQTAYNRARLGDATGESRLTTTSTSWYSDLSYFVNSSYPWLVRGGSAKDSSKSGVFYLDRNNGGNFYGYTTRAALLSLQ